MDLESLKIEHATDGVGPHLYEEICDAVRLAIHHGHYPASYSPYGRWDNPTFDDLTQEWLVEKLLRNNHLSYLLIRNNTVETFRFGLRQSFCQFLIGQRKRNALQNLFRRSADLLEADARFHCFQGGKRAQSRWGLTAWKGPELFAGDDHELRVLQQLIPGPKVIRYRPDARKLSPILSDADLADFIARLMDAVGRTVSLAHITDALKWRFGLIDAEPLSLDEPVAGEDGTFTRADSVAHSAPSPEDQVVRSETAGRIIMELTPRQRQVLVARTEIDSTYAGIATRLDCSKSTVENEIKAGWDLIRSRTDGDDEATEVHDQILELLDAERPASSPAGM